MNVIFYARHKNTITEAVRRRSGTWFSFRKKKMFEVPNCASGTFLAWWGVIGAGCDGISTHMCTCNTCTPLFKTYTMDKYSWVIHHQQPERVWGGVQKAFVSLFDQTRGVFAHLFFIDTARFQATRTRRRPRHTQRIGKYPSLGFCSMLRLTIELELIRLKLATKRYRS